MAAALLFFDARRLVKTLALSTAHVLKPFLSLFFFYKLNSICGTDKAIGGCDVTLSRRCPKTKNRFACFKFQVGYQSYIACQQKNDDVEQAFLAG